MAVELVGAVGAPASGSSVVAVAPAWGTGATRAKDNLLVFPMVVAGLASAPPTPTGWSILKQIAGTSCIATIFGKRAAGGDAAPSSQANTAAYGALYEFASVRQDATLTYDTSSAAGTTSPLVATNTLVDLEFGWLMFYCGVAYHSAALTTSDSMNLNNATSNDLTNSATSLQGHYVFGYGITGRNPLADKATYTFTTTNITGAALALATLRAAPTGGSQRHRQVRGSNPGPSRGRY